MPDSIQAETSFSYHRALFSDIPCVFSKKTATFEVQIGRIENGKVSATVNKKSSDGAAKLTDIRLAEGDTLNLDHTFNIEGKATVEDDHPFPIKLEFKGQTYFLKRTKADKLILTK